MHGYYYECTQLALKHLDKDAIVSFADKHFVLSGYGDDMNCEEAQQIVERGGFLHEKMVKSADYLVVQLGSCGQGKLMAALEWRKKGSNVKIISDEMMKQAFSYKECKRPADIDDDTERDYWDMDALIGDFICKKANRTLADKALKLGKKIKLEVKL